MFEPFWNQLYNQQKGKRFASIRWNSVHESISGSNRKYQRRIDSSQVCWTTLHFGGSFAFSVDSNQQVYICKNQDKLPLDEIQLQPTDKLCPYHMYAILVSSIFGNSVIIHIIQKENSKKITTNYLIVNQACTADLMVSFHRYTVED